MNITLTTYKPIIAYCGGKRNNKKGDLKLEEVFQRNRNVLLTKVSEEEAETVKYASNFVEEYKNQIIVKNGTILVCPDLTFKSSRNKVKIAITSAGRADESIVNEALLTLNAHGYNATVFGDMGINDMDYLLSQAEKLKDYDIIISVQGFEGALPAVLANQVDAPIISVPTSTGYGVSNDGTSALNTSLSSCTPGISVVNIDNGFGGAMCAMKFAYKMQKNINRIKSGK